MNAQQATIYAHTAAGTITWGGNDYLGVGTFGDLSTLTEDSELSRSPLTLTLSGVDAANIALALNEHYRGRAATISVGYRDNATGALVATPTVVYLGLMDYMEESGGVLTLHLESKFRAWDSPNVRRHNNADQQAVWPDDKFFEYQEQMNEARIVI